MNKFLLGAKKFLLALLFCIAFLGVYSLFVGFLYNYFGDTAGLLGIWIFLIGTIFLIIYRSYKHERLDFKKLNFRKFFEEILFSFKFLVISIATIISLGAFVYLSYLIGSKIGSAGIIILLLTIIILLIVNNQQE